MIFIYSSVHTKHKNLNLDRLNHVIDFAVERYYFPCANDDDIPTCFMCQHSFSSIKSLYDHLKRHPDPRWRAILPPDLHNATVIVRHTLLPPGTISDFPEGLKVDDEK